MHAPGLVESRPFPTRNCGRCGALPFTSRLLKQVQALILFKADELAKTGIPIRKRLF